MNERIKDQKGITIIALVVTIIILFILTAVVLVNTMGNSGVITRAGQAADEWDRSADAEDKELDKLDKEVDDKLTSMGINIKKSSQETLAVKTFKVGDYLYYDTSNTNIGNNGVVLARVLHDSTGSYGVQIITEESVADITLGSKTDMNKAKNDADNCGTILSNACAPFFNSDYAVDYRSVGNRAIIDDNGFFSKKTDSNSSYSDDASNLKKVFDFNEKQMWLASKSNRESSSPNYYSNTHSVDCIDKTRYVDYVDIYSEVVNFDSKGNISRTE